MSNELRNTIKELDRDCEIWSNLIKSELRIYNDIDIYYILDDYRRFKGGLDAEGFIEYIKSETYEDRILYPRLDLNKAIKIIKNRTGLDDNKAKELAIHASRMSYNLESMKENTFREYFIKNSKGYKECKSDKEKENYIKSHF